MKKVSILAAVAIATGLASCTAQAPKATLKTDVDSLSYAIGISQTNGLKDYLSQRMEMDTAYIADFLKGVNDAANKTSKKRPGLSARSADRITDGWSSSYQRYESSAVR